MAARSSASFQRFVALRYLRGAQGRDEGRRFLRFVTYAAIGGVALGVAALLLSLMIVRGFSREIENKIVGFGAHVRVESYVDQPLTDDTLATSLARLPGVERVTPVVDEFALLRSKSGIDGAVVTGTVEGQQEFLAEQVQAGAFTFAPDSAGRPGVVIGKALAELLAVEVGSQLTAFSMREYGGGVTVARPRVRAFYVAGIYETGLADFDEVFAYTDLAAARALFGYADDQVTRFDLQLDDIDRADATAATITETYGVPVYARSIFQVQQNLFAWVNLQQSVVPLVIGVIVLVAAFNIIGTLLMVTLEKTREIGIILSMGCPADGVKRLFVWLGFLIGRRRDGAGDGARARARAGATEVRADPAAAGGVLH